MSPFTSKQSVPLILVIISLGVYLSTICPTVYLGDSGELIAAAFSLGIPHGSGYPLYTLVGKLFCLIPLGNIGFRLNLMSGFFAVMTVWLVYSFIYRITDSKVGAFAGGLVLAFLPVLWSQTVCAEVYTLHTFFVALLIRLLWWWDETREFSHLILLVFITGIGFGNHLQTVMLAPAVLFIVLSGDRKALLSVRHFLALAFFFGLALLIYVYLPIRTGAGAAIHWGDPDTLDRFLAHVTGRSHRYGYVLNKTPLEYLVRTKETLWFVWSQLGVILLLAVWGWLKLVSVRWRVFFVLIIIFDFFYTIFLNIISLEITAFSLPTCIVLAILAGIGIAHIIKAIKGLQDIGTGTKKAIKTACCVIPFMFLFSNYGLCDQSRNYTAYEHAVNIFRTVGNGNILFLDGDNNFFPVIYGRIAERMRKDVILFDRQDIMFRIPSLTESKGYFYGKWKDLRDKREKQILKKAVPDGVFYAILSPRAISMPDGYDLVPYCLLHRVVKKDISGKRYRIANEWKYYSSESLYDNLERDYLNRQTCAFFYFRYGQYFFMAGDPVNGLRYIQNASRIGYNDTGIHSAIGIFLTDQGFFKEARKELEKALIYNENLSVAHNNWGYYYYKTGFYNKAVDSFRKAVKLRPEDEICHKNLGYALFRSGRKNEAEVAFQKSLSINGDQPEILRFMEEHGLKRIDM